MNHDLDTRLLHIGSAPFDPVTGTAPVNLPSMRTSTVRFENLDRLQETVARRMKGERPITYGRSGMDTHRALEEVFNALEGGCYTCLAPSGLAAINILFMTVLQAGDHVLISDSVYAPVRNLNNTTQYQNDLRRVARFLTVRDDRYPRLSQNRQCKRPRFSR